MRVCACVCMEQAGNCMYCGTSKFAAGIDNDGTSLVSESIKYVHGAEGLTSKTRLCNCSATLGSSSIPFVSSLGECAFSCCRQPSPPAEAEFQARES
jgi:hypothetical protein